MPQPKAPKTARSGNTNKWSPDSIANGIEGRANLPSAASHHRPRRGRGAGPQRGDDRLAREGDQIRPRRRGELRSRAGNLQYAIHGGNGAPPMPHVVHDMVEIGRNVDEGASDSPKTSPSARHWREKGRLIVVGAATTATRRRTCFNAEIARLARTSMPWATCRTIHSHVTNALAYVARG